MRHKKKIILGIIIAIFIILNRRAIVLILLSVIMYAFPTITIAPQRHTSIPKKATWIGGPDSGYWFDIVDINKDKETYRFRIYHNYTGSLEIDADFKKDSLCNRNYPLNKAILQKINAFDYSKIIMIGNPTCTLKVVDPIYGGSYKND